MDNKSYLIIFESSLFDSLTSQQGLDFALSLASLSQTISMVFLKHGLLQLKTDLSLNLIGRKNYCEAFKALKHFDISNIYTNTQSLEFLNLGENDLIIPIQLIDELQMQQLLITHEIILRF
ncbi:MAG: DsrE family protein [Francisellaceae bacterium]|nr:DsrE family protein [Francisellaceae bacterium]